MPDIIGKLDPVDICIVGSGASGGVLARELAGRNRSVVVLEVGSKTFRGNVGTASPDWELRVQDFLPQDHERDRITLGKDSEPFYLVRFKGVGGSTMHYEGICHRMHPSDLRRFSDLGVGADWPLRYEDLAPHYDRVEDVLGVSGTLDNPFGSPRGPYPNPPLAFSCAVEKVASACRRLGLHPAHVAIAILTRPRVERGQMECNFCGGCIYGCMHGAISNMSETYIPDAVRDGARILERCMATRIVLNADGRTVRGVEFLDERGEMHLQEAKVVAICGNAVETARLLLLSSTSDHPDGLANGSGLVGLNFMVHNHVRISALTEERIDAYRGPNVNGVLEDFHQHDSRRPYVGGFTVALRNGQFGPVSFFHDWAYRDRLFGDELHARMERSFGHSMEIDGYGESFPHESNCVRLDPSVKDKFGLPVPQITIRRDDNSHAMITYMKKVLTEVMEAAGAIETRVLRDRPLGTHLMGTCRMGTDPKKSVCTPFGQTHDIRNLFIADGSLFPTATPSNPTLTIQAMATRIAFHIDERFTRGG
jgi:choline dehydrogenase-like flavoprotein